MAWQSVNLLFSAMAMHGCVTHRTARAMHRCETQCEAKAMHDKDRPSTEMARQRLVGHGNGKAKICGEMAR